MGGLISKPVNFVRTKVDDTKTAIRTKIDNTKNSIKTFVNGITTGIVTRVTNTKKAICGTVTGIRDGIVNTVTNTTNAVVDTVAGVKNTVVGGINTVKTGIGTKIHELSQMSKKRQVVYGFLVFPVLGLSLTLGLISVDLYKGNYAGAQYKWDKLQSVAGGALHLVQRTTVLAIHGMENAGYYGAKFASKLTSYVLTASEWISEYMVYGVMQGSKHLGHGIVVAADYTSHSIMVAANYTYIGSCAGGKVLYEGATYLGSQFLSGSQTFGTAAYHGAIFFGSWSKDTAGVLYGWTTDGCITVAHWTKVYGGVLIEWLFYVSQLIFHYGNIVLHFTVHILTTVIKTVYHILVVLSDFIYRWSGISFPFLLRWTYSLVVFLGEWVAVTVPAVTKWIYVVVNRHGLRWLWTVLQYFLDYVCVAFLVVGKFLQDIAIHVGNFLYLAGQGILRVLYIIYNFLYNILSVFASAFKGSLQGIASVVETVFNSIAWFMQETVIAYMYMLHKYNVYRELLFLAFILVITVYCTGLMRDNRDDEPDSGASRSVRKKKRRSASRENSPAQNGSNTDAGAVAKDAPPPAYHAGAGLMPDAEDSDLDESDLDIDLPDSVPDPMDLDFETDIDDLDLDENEMMEEVNEADLPTEEFPDFSDEDKETEEEAPGLFERLQNIKFRTIPPEPEEEQAVPDIGIGDNDPDDIREEDLIPHEANMRNTEVETMDDNNSGDEFSLPVTRATLDELEPRSRDTSKSPADFDLPDIGSSDENHAGLRDSSDSPPEFALPEEAELPTVEEYVEDHATDGDVTEDTADRHNTETGQVHSDPAEETGVSEEAELAPGDGEHIHEDAVDPSNVAGVANTGPPTQHS